VDPSTPVNPRPKPPAPDPSITELVRLGFSADQAREIMESKVSLYEHRDWQGAQITIPLKYAHIAQINDKNLLYSRTSSMDIEIPRGEFVRVGLHGGYAGDAQFHQRYGYWVNRVRVNEDDLGGTSMNDKAVAVSWWIKPPGSDRWLEPPGVEAVRFTGREDEGPPVLRDFVVRVPANETVDVAYFINQSATLYIQIQTEDGSNDLLDAWWIKWGTGSVSHLGAQRGVFETKVPINGLKGVLAAKLRAHARANTLLHCSLTKIEPGQLGGWKW
jgi:hypothetical protein